MIGSLIGDLMGFIFLKDAARISIAFEITSSPKKNDAGAIKVKVKLTPRNYHFFKGKAWTKFYAGKRITDDVRCYFI